jgi:putative mRNA 3-end processing factor
MSVLVETSSGLYCPAGDFYVDPWRGVDRAVITHAHSDHARIGSRHYLAAKAGHAILQMRLGSDANIQFVPYGQVQTIGQARVSLHPAGHMTGAAQVRIEVAGHVTVVTGDYKLQPDPTCEAFEPIKCHTFVTESTFGLPIYSWHDTDQMIASINDWWLHNQSNGRATVLLAYTVGKAQRLLASIDSSIGPIVAHGAILNACRAYADCGVRLPVVQGVQDAMTKEELSKMLVIAPPSSQNSTWMNRFGDVSMGVASGWMRVRGIRRRRSLDRGFVISDHVDWNDLFTAIRSTQCEQVWVTHGYTRQVVQALLELGFDAREVKTEFSGDEEAASESPESAADPQSGEVAS